MKSKKNYLTKLSQEDIDVLVVQVQKTIEKNNTLIKVLNSRLKEIDKEQLKECKNIGGEDNVWYIYWLDSKSKIRIHG